MRYSEHTHILHFVVWFDHVISRLWTIATAIVTDVVGFLWFFCCLSLTFSSFDNVHWNSTYECDDMWTRSSEMMCDAFVKSEWIWWSEKHRNNMIRMLTRHHRVYIIDKMLRQSISCKCAMKSRCTKFNSHNATTWEFVMFISWVLYEFHLGVCVCVCVDHKYWINRPYSVHFDE